MYLATIPDDLMITQQSGDLGIGITHKNFRVEVVKSLAKIVAPMKNGAPAQAGLETFEADFFEKDMIARCWNAPFRIMISGEQRIVGWNRACLAASDV